jgi:hypothetical protein
MGGGLGGMYRLHVNVGGLKRFCGGGHWGEEGGGKAVEFALAQAETSSGAAQHGESGNTGHKPSQVAEICYVTSPAYLLQRECNREIVGENIEHSRIQPADLSQLFQTLT